MFMASVACCMLTAPTEGGVLRVLVSDIRIQRCPSGHRG